MPALTVEPEAISEVSLFRTLATTNSGASFRRNVYPSGKKSRRRYVLSWDVASESDLDALESLIKLINGAGTFTWTPPGGTLSDFMIVYQVSIKRQQATGSVRMTIEEV